MKMDDYSRKARMYPAVLSLFLPITLLLGFVICSIDCFTPLSVAYPFVFALISSSLLTAAIRWGLAEVCRQISKFLFQYPLFKEDESNMPTTDMLLWSDDSYPVTIKQMLHKKVLDKYGVKLYSKRAETADPVQARKLIASAVRLIREDTRDNKMLYRFNIDFGFWRNMAGGSLLGGAIVGALWVFNCCVFVLPLWLFAWCFAVENLLFLGALLFLRISARSYARQLITVFLKL